MVIDRTNWAARSADALKAVNQELESTTQSNSSVRLSGYRLVVVICVLALSTVLPRNEAQPYSP